MSNKFNIPEWLLNSPTYYVVVIGMNSKYLYANECFINKFNFLSDDLTSINVIDTIYHGDYVTCESAVKECIEQPNKVVQVKLRKPKEDNTYFWTSWDFSLLGINPILFVSQ